MYGPPVGQGPGAIFPSDLVVAIERQVGIFQDPVATFFLEQPHGIDTIPIAPPYRPHNISMDCGVVVAILTSNEWGPLENDFSFVFWPIKSPWRADLNVGISSTQLQQQR